MRRGRPAVTNNGDVDLPVNELIPTCLCLAEMQYVDGFREFPGAPGGSSAASSVHSAVFQVSNVVAVQDVGWVPSA
jgi:hypothetical protein